MERSCVQLIKILCRAQFLTPTNIFTWPYNIQCHAHYCLTLLLYLVLQLFSINETLTILPLKRIKQKVFVQEYLNIYMHVDVVQ